MTNNKEQFIIHNVVMTNENIICFIEHNKEHIEVVFTVQLIKSSRPQFSFINHSHFDTQYAYNQVYTCFHDFLMKVLLKQTLSLPQTFSVELPF